MRNVGIDDRLVRDSLGSGVGAAGYRVLLGDTLRVSISMTDTEGAVRVARSVI